MLGQLDALLQGAGGGSGGSSSCGGAGGREEPDLEEETRALAQRARHLVAAKARFIQLKPITNLRCACSDVSNQPQHSL